VSKEEDAKRYRAEADECRRQAEQAAKMSGKESWLRLAADWDNLAEDAEHGRGRFRKEE
jgi:hypothetical protein